MHIYVRDLECTCEVQSCLCHKSRNMSTINAYFMLQVVVKLSFNCVDHTTVLKHMSFALLRMNATLLQMCRQTFMSSAYR